VSGLLAMQRWLIKVDSLDLQYSGRPDDQPSIDQRSRIQLAGRMDPAGRSQTRRGPSTQFGIACAPATVISASVSAMAS